jgi:hypothetical protein
MMSSRCGRIDAVSKDEPALEFAREDFMKSQCGGFAAGILA